MMPILRQKSDPAKAMDFCISRLIRLLFETGMRSNALAHAYLKLTGFSVTIHTLHTQRSNTLTLRTAKNVTNDCHVSNMRLRIRGNY